MAARPERFGKYEVLDVAGKGAMAVVYVGRDPETDRRVAIKTCQPALNLDPAERKVAEKVFMNEAHSAGALKHPNIIEIYEAGEDNRRLWIAMEYVEGGATLESYVKPDKLLPVKRVVEIFYQCVNALGYAHRQGVIHRDVKPSNIMLTPDGAVKICDFGVAFNALGDMTQVMGFMGTPKYMSPEQTHEEDATNRTDLYALGLVMYELLTGRPPIAGDSLSALFLAIREQVPTPIGYVRPGLPDRLEKILVRLLEKEPAKRYGNGQEIARELASVFGEL